MPLIDKDMEDDKESEAKLYELGFLLDPVIPEDAVAGETAKISQLVESHGGKIEVAGTPSLRALAYTVEIARAGKRYKYDQAHFSWLKFWLVPGEIEGLEHGVKKMVSVIRHLLVRGTMASTTPAVRRYIKKDEALTPEVGEVKKATEAEIDKEVDALIASADKVTVAK
jgi:ribosomal protein S6